MKRIGEYENYLQLNKDEENGAILLGVTLWDNLFGDLVIVPRSIYPYGERIEFLVGDVVESPDGRKFEVVGLDVIFEEMQIVGFNVMEDYQPTYYKILEME